MGLTQKQLDAMAKSNRESNFLTREAIKEALYLLMQEKAFPDIRITEIIDRAGVSRSAFYHNYKTKEDVLLESMRDTQNDIFTHTSNDLQRNWEAIFAQVQSRKKSLQLLLDAGLEGHLLDSINEYSNFQTTDYYTALWNGLIFNAILFYAEAGFPDPKEAASEVHGAMLTMAKLVERKIR